MSREEDLGGFFRRYARVSLGPEPEKLAEYYDASFLAAGPRGGAAFPNDEAFLAWLREVHAFNVSSGMTSMTVGEISEIPVSADYTLATVQWIATFQRTGESPIQFRISYLIRQAGEAAKIAAFISHEDQDDLMRAKGLI